MIGCLVLIGLLFSAAIGKRPGALIYLLLVALYIGLRHWSHRAQAPEVEEGESLEGYESEADWRRAKRIEGRLAWSGVVILTISLYFYFSD